MLLLLCIVPIAISLPLLLIGIDMYKREKIKLNQILELSEMQLENKKREVH